jgi:class 3 adenylate cyclase
VEHQRQRAIKGLPAFHMRIGIHTGNVIGGIVGLHKFAFDIWGDAVNIAARMENSGEVGRVNISSDTYERIKDLKEFTFIPRGMVQTKGKGRLQMYFVSLLDPQSIPITGETDTAIIRV